MNFVGHELDRTPGENLSLIHYIWVLSWETWVWCWHHLQSPSRTYLGVGAGCPLGPQRLSTWTFPWGHSTDILRAWCRVVKAGILRERTVGGGYITFCGLSSEVSQHHFHPNLFIRSKPTFKRKGIRLHLSKSWEEKLDLLWKIKYLFILIIFKITNYLYIYYMNRLEASISQKTFLSMI